MVYVPVFLQNENPNSESNISLTNNDKISKPNISTENEHHIANSSLLTKGNDKDKERKQWREGETKIEEQCCKKDPNCGRFYN